MGSLVVVVVFLVVVVVAGGSVVGGSVAGGSTMHSVILGHSHLSLNPSYVRYGDPWQSVLGRSQSGQAISDAYPFEHIMNLVQSVGCTYVPLGFPEQS